VTAFHTPLAGATPDKLDAAIGALTEDDWQRLEHGYIDCAAIYISDWWVPALGLPVDVDAADLFCTLYRLSLARGSERQS
jgi:hypothetical protein